MKLTRLTHRLKERKSALAKHSAKFKRHHKADHRLRAAYQRRRIIADKKAIKKLNGLIAKERKSQKDIDWNGLPHLTNASVLRCLKVALKVPGLFLTATTNGVHSPGSYHYSGRAFDGGSDGSQGETPEKTAQKLLLDTFGAGAFMELFGPCDWYVKNGVLYDGVFPGHGDHLHAAPY